MAPLLGRSDDIGRVTSAIARTGRCCIVGVGGLGKTTLARASVSELGRPTVVIDTEPIEHLGGLLDALVAALHVESVPGEPVQAAIAAAFDAGSTLVVIDGAEHLADGLADLLSTWHPAPGGPAVLVTSRTPIRGLEPVHRPRPLGFDPDDPAASDTMTLLLERFDALAGDLELVAGRPAELADVAASTGGLPLAIELAAAHLARFGLLTGDADGFGPTAGIAPGVDACVERSLRVLDTEAVDLFALVGVTAGRIDVALLETLGGPLPAGSLAALVDHGLIRPVDGGFEVLPPVRDSARRRFDAADPDRQVLRRVLDRAVAAMPVDRHEYADWAFIDRHLDTYVHLAALAYDAFGPSSTLLALANGLFEPLHARQHNLDALTLIERAIGTADDADPPALDRVQIAKAARRAAICASECVNVVVGERWLDRAERAADSVPDAAGLRCCIDSIRAAITIEAGHLSAGVSIARRAIHAGDPSDADDRFFVEQARRHLAEALTALGELDAAESELERVRRWSGGRSATTDLFALLGFAWVAVERGDRLAAASLASQIRDAVRGNVDYETEVSAEAEILRLLADPNARLPVDWTPADDAGLPWVVRLERRLHHAENAADDDPEQLLHTASDVAVLADLVPLGHTRVLALLSVGDAALRLGDLHHAGVAYESALRNAQRGPYRLRCADALDGIASLAVARERPDLAPAATGLADAIRSWCGAKPWARPALVARHTFAEPPPADWMRDHVPTLAAIDALVVAGTRPPIAHPFDVLTRTERQVAMLAADGLSNQEIATALVVSRRTVESHLARSYQKLGVRTRGQLAATARR